ncbi:Crp/Fnr family transcriptional regulator [Flavobacterium columnare]|uniref:Crp/Fnr family transcriptional regulator n=1 Tax=Flavobacterium columnare TaxID=996 RepID=A0AAI8CIE8_9FLAO|nr:Crp/Fnr family transcriptional regulator [Flavobacterium columnare]AMO20533.1 Crp/Fnr family transcriptional regulator [Flavobacterium columnare]AUX18504.1 cyclic nucleotide-binding protein [Flavobacterium columnare]QOG57587.1 Crp/Fnr family transcriptional regulator [Flavobacterium columnare]QOG60311.1 Crp/Fnr family transcriptional regulator [Flavobacterium columnare]QOG63031.1 Crp/Fnr family transcriptional regulator [Flavobacterium columnare]
MVQTNKLLTTNDIDFSEVIKQFQSHFKPLYLKKNTFFVEQNEICRFFCFITSGILQHAIEIDHEEKTTYLSLKNTFTASLKSFLTQSPSRKHIKALVNTELLVISLEDFMKLKEENPVFNQFYYDLIERQSCLIDDYRIDLLALSPEERYKKLLENEPKLLNEVPLHYLSSFLGISNRHMSRIRKNSLQR